VIRRDDRFGCLKLATDAKLEPRDFIRCSCRQGERRVAFYIELGYSLKTGAPLPDEDCGAKIRLTSAAHANRGQHSRRSMGQLT